MNALTDSDKLEKLTHQHQVYHIKTQTEDHGQPVKSYKKFH